MQKILKILHHQNKNFDIRQNSTIIFRHGLDLPRVIGIIEYRGNVNFNLLSFPTYFHALSLNGQKNGRGSYPLPFFCHMRASQSDPPRYPTPSRLACWKLWIAVMVCSPAIPSAAPQLNPIAFSLA